MDDKRTIKIEMTITHTDSLGQMRQVSQSRVYRTGGDNKFLIQSDISEKVSDFDNSIISRMLEGSEVWK